MLVQVEIEEHMGDLPSIVESQKLEIDAIQSENEQKQEQITQIDKDIRHHEAEIEDLRFTINQKVFKSKILKSEFTMDIDQDNQIYIKMNQKISSSGKLSKSKLKIDYSPDFDENFKIKIVETLWNIIYSDGNSDMYESNFMRRLTGLLYLDNKIVGDIKEKTKNKLNK